MQIRDHDGTIVLTIDPDARLTNGERDDIIRATVRGEDAFMRLLAASTDWGDCRAEEFAERCQQWASANPEPLFRVVDDGDRYRVEGTDNNGAWVDADPGDRFDAITEAEDAAESWARQRGGKYIGLA